MANKEVAEREVAERQLAVADLPPVDGPRAPHGLFDQLTYGFRRGELPEVQEPVGFFTDTSVCIGCKACQVACKEWNLLAAQPGEFSGHSYDNTLKLSALEWRHVKFVEIFEELPLLPAPLKPTANLGGFDLMHLLDERKAGQWLMMSDSCKHCASAPCQHACPTGAIVHTEFANVFIQPDICNGCGSCVASCPFGVVTRSEDANGARGHAYKCTLCYDRLRDGLEPACARACPTWAINFGPLAALQEQARDRLAHLQARGATSASLYGMEPGANYSALHNFYLLLDEPVVYGLPAAPRDPGTYRVGDYLRAGLALVVALELLLAVLLVTGGLP